VRNFAFAVAIGCKADMTSCSAHSAFDPKRTSPLTAVLQPAILFTQRSAKGTGNAHLVILSHLGIDRKEDRAILSELGLTQVVMRLLTRIAGLAV
jgi:hypothetical protein